MIRVSLFGEFLSAFQRSDVTLFLTQPFESLLISVLTESASLSHSSSVPVLGFRLLLEVTLCAILRFPYYFIITAVRILEEWFALGRLHLAG